MSISVNLHRTHRQYADGLETIEVEGRTIGDCLQDVVRKFPQMGPVLFDKQGKLNSLLDIFLNLESAYPDELKRPVKDGDEIHVTLLLSGG